MFVYPNGGESCDIRDAVALPRRPSKRFSDLLKADQRFNIGDRVRWVVGRGMPFAVITSVRLEEPDPNVKGLVPGYRYSWLGHCDVPQSELVAAPEESK